MNTTTQTPETPETPDPTTPIEAAAIALASQILNDESKKTGRPILSGDENAETVVDWIEHIADKIVKMTSVIDLGELPLARRERLDMETLLGDFRPMRIDFTDLDSAVEKLDEAATEMPLDGHETELRESFARLMQAMQNAGGDCPALLHGYESEFLNEQIPHDLPDWINDAIDWDSVYRSVTDDADVVYLPSGDYTVLGIYTR